MITHKYIKNISTLSLDKSKCTGCRMCINVCPHNVFEMAGKTVAIINPDSCMECGACVMNCQYDALSVDSGVGCAAAVINGIIRNTEPNCDCGDKGSSCC